MLEQVIGLDHVVVTVRDLDAAAANWRALGFTLSPRGTHSAHMGTGNYTIMLGEDYLELLGVLAPTEHNAPTRAYLARREGVERAAFTARDAAAGVAELKARGIPATGPMDFGRPVDMPDGRQTQARFSTFNWPVEERPGDLRLFACEHHTREAVWIPQLLTHANGATSIERLEILASDPAAAAAHMGRLVDRTPEKLADGAWRVVSGGTRANFEFLNREQLAARHPGAAVADLPAEGSAALVLRVASLAKARAALAAAVPVQANPDSLVVPASHANGILLVLVPA